MEGNEENTSILHACTMNQTVLLWHGVVICIFFKSQVRTYLTRSGERCNVFLRIVDLFDGKAETIEKVLLQFCDVAGIEMRRVMGFWERWCSSYGWEGVRHFYPLESAQPSHDKHSLCCP